MKTQETNHFRTVLKSTTKESKKDADGFYVFDIYECHPVAFAVMLNWILSGDISLKYTEGDFIYEIIRLSDMYFVNGLKKFELEKMYKTLRAQMNELLVHIGQDRILSDEEQKTKNKEYSQQIISFANHLDFLAMFNNYPVVNKEKEVSSSGKAVSSQGIIKKDQEHESISTDFEKFGVLFLAVCSAHRFEVEVKRDLKNFLQKNSSELLALPTKTIVKNSVNDLISLRANCQQYLIEGLIRLYMEVATSYEKMVVPSFTNDFKKIITSTELINFEFYSINLQFAVDSLPTKMMNIFIKSYYNKIHNGISKAEILPTYCKSDLDNMIKIFGYAELTN